MRTALWETSAGALAAFLSTSRQCYLADLYTITLSGGAVLRYTGADTSVPANGLNYLAGPVITRGDVTTSVGVAVDALSITIAPDPANALTINGTLLLPFIVAGGLDGARVALDQAYALAPGAPWVGALSLFAGRMGEVKPGRYGAALTVESDSKLLDVMVPRNVYKPGCGRTLFDGGCGVSKSAYATGATATSATDAARTTFSTGLGQAAGYFALGWAVGVTGANTGVGRTIKTFASGAITVIQPWPSAVTAGDAFTVYPGCDKTMGTCNSKFGNLLRFKGYPFVPAPETVT